MSKDSQLLGSHVIASCMAANGIKRIHIFPGGTIGPVLDIVHDWNIEIFTTRHEQAAGYAALGTAKLTGKPQVVMVTSGPGVTNVLTPVADAYFDSIPLVILTGQVATSDMKSNLPVRQRGFQEVDTVALFKPITKAQFLPKHSSELAEVMNDAFRIAKTGRPGPVVVDLPMDVQKEPVDVIPDFQSYTKQNLLIPDVSTINKIIDLLCLSKKPLIICGNGVLISRSYEELREFINKTKINTSSSLLGLGGLPTNSEFSLGYHGHTGSRYANLAIHESDLLLVLGSRLDVRQTGSVTKEFAPNAKVIHIDLDLAELEHARVHTELQIHADIKKTLQIINDKLQNIKLPDWSEWNEQIKQWKSEYRLSYDSKKVLKPQYIIETANKLTKGVPLVCVTGVGQHQQWTARHFDFDFPTRILLTSGGHGAMGFDLPVSIGAQLNELDKLVLCFVGDGSLQINIQELATIANYNLPIKIIVLDNQRFGIVSQFQNITWGKDPSCGNLKNPDFSAIAKAYGIFTETVSTANEIESKLERIFSHNGPALLHCNVDPSEDVIPMLLGGQTMDKMWPYD
jgi:acetolactate synthase-1/2/3 large subunit